MMWNGCVKDWDVRKGMNIALVIELLYKVMKKTVQVLCMKYQ